MLIIDKSYLYIVAVAGPDPDAITSKSKRMKVNKFVSTLRSPPLTSLRWAPLPDKKIRQSKVWEFMGVLLVFDTASGRSCPFDDDLIHCKLCFEEEILRGKDGHMSKIYCAKKSTASGNHLLHATQKHRQDFTREASTSNAKMTSWLLSAENPSQPAQNQHEFNRDIALFMCRDLVPFNAVEKSGFTVFCEKNTLFTPPTANTVANSALVDVYSVVKNKIKGLLASCHAGTLMMDGWTDRYKCHPYFGVRFSFIHDWEFKVVTLSMQPVESHTAVSLSKFVKDILGEFMPHYKKMLLFNTTDGAANMRLLSKILGHERVDCTAHCLHLLLTVDSMDKIPELKVLLRKCKDVIDTLHFKGHLIRSMQDISKDIEMFDRVNVLLDELSEDECNPILDIVSESGGDSSPPEAGTHTGHGSRHGQCQQQQSLGANGHGGHQTLKNQVCTRWNSTLMMIESILDLQKPLNEALKKIGKFDQCLTEDDLSTLTELRTFLSSFKPLTQLVSECNPNLSLLPLMRTRIMKACHQCYDEFGQCTDSSALIQLKKLVRAAVDKRIKVNDLVKLTTCFDPAVRNAMLSNDECSQLLQDVYQSLINEESPVRHVFIGLKSSSVSLSIQQQVDMVKDVGDDISAKSLRNSLIQVTF